MPSQSIAIIPSQAVPSVDLEKIIYFAISVFWRAGAHLWKQIDRGTQINLGPYEEHLRFFLLAEAPFPKNTALIVNVADSPKPALVAHSPCSDRVQGVRRHRFHIPGIAFWLYLGRLPSAMTALCAVSSGVLCLVKNLDENMVHEFGDLVRSNRQARDFKAG